MTTADRNKEGGMKSLPTSEGTCNKLFASQKLNTGIVWTSFRWLKSQKMSPIKTSHSNYSKASRSMRAKADLLPNCYLVVADESIHELLWTTDEVKVGNWMHGMPVVQGIFLVVLSNRLPQKSPHQVAEILIGNNINRMAQKEKEQFILH